MRDAGGSTLRRQAGINRQPSGRAGCWRAGRSATSDGKRTGVHSVTVGKLNAVAGRAIDVAFAERTGRRSGIHIPLCSPVRADNILAGWRTARLAALKLNPLGLAGERLWAKYCIKTSIHVSTLRCDGTVRAARLGVLPSLSSPFARTARPTVLRARCHLLGHRCWSLERYGRGGGRHRRTVRRWRRFGMPPGRQHAEPQVIPGPPNQQPPQLDDQIQQPPQTPAQTASQRVARYQQTNQTCQPIID